MMPSFPAIESHLATLLAPGAQVISENWLEIVGRLVLAMAIGAACGWERELERRAAGLRTYMMVSLGAAGFILLGVELLAQVAPEDPSLRYDPSRVLAGIVTGVGFLGAGTIIQSEGRVRGLTTAAGLWAIAAAGAASGAGAYRLAILLGVFTLFVLAIMKSVDRWIDQPPQKDRASPDHSE